MGAVGLILAFGVAAWIVRFRGDGAENAGPQAVRAGVLLPRLDAAAGWINGGPLTPDSLAGRPTAVILWSDTDPRSLDALPWAESWHRAYAPFGARVVGVHVPDYSFGADSMVSARVARRMGLHFPIALDPHYQILSAFGRDEERPARPHETCP